ncbi:MAG: selenocysteine-specific translation elongation factor [Acidimicrobiia bacterium]
MAVVATAGHVDHGKSALVEALTGRDPDRLAEEKRRGLTIELGFAWMDLPGGRRISFVDVPGHRRFIANMLAGVGAVDAVLLVVAADEGWSAQSEEHLAALDLLGLRRGVVALTKIDRVEPATVPGLIRELGRHLQGTFLEGETVVPVSVRRRVGLDELVLALAEATNADVGDQGRPRLWVDRVFGMAGAGLVATGTLTGGGLRTGDQLEVWPGGGIGRIKGLHSNEQAVQTVPPSTRVAVNLGGAGALARGSLLTKPATTAASNRWLADLQPARYVAKLEDKGSFVLHLGTFAGAATIRLVAPNLALIATAVPLPVAAGDRFLMRDTGRQRVLAGGTVLDPAPPRRQQVLILHGHALERALPKGPDEVAAVLLHERGQAQLSDLALWSKGGSPREVLTADGVAISIDEQQRLGVEVVAAVSQFLADHPFELGLGIGQLAQQLDIGEGLLRSLCDQDSKMVLAGGMVSLAGIERATSEADERWLAARVRLATPAPPSIAELGLGPDLLRALIKDGQAIRIADDLLYLPSVIKSLIATTQSFDEPFSVSDFRQRVGISRKYAVPLLEYFDREGITLRQGDRRQARPL